MRPTLLAALGINRTDFTSFLSMHVRCARDPFLSEGLSCGHSERKERSKSKRSLLQFIASLHSKVWDKAGRVQAAIPEPGALDRTLWRWAKSGQTARHAAPAARRTCDVVSCGGCARFRAREQLLSSRVFSQARWSLFLFFFFFPRVKLVRRLRRTQAGNLLRWKAAAFGWTPWTRVSARLSAC